MKILFLGDIVGRSGRDAVIKHLPTVKQSHKIDFVIVSGDNAASGFGLSMQNARDLLVSGVDVITGGDHIWDQKEIYSYLEQERKILRPANYPQGVPGFGFGIFPAPNNRKVAVLHLEGQVFMKHHVMCPFAAAETFLSNQRLGTTVNAIFVDFHAEATSEKMAMGHLLDGRVSAVIGTHTHVPTNDARLLQHGTAYITDAGMCGDYNSVIGFQKEGALNRFLTKIPRMRLEPAEGEGTMCGVIVETDDVSGVARSINPIRVGGSLC